MSAVGETTAAIRSSHFQWPAIFGGAVAAAGVSFTLHSFAAGVGLSVLSTAPTWRDSNAFYWVVCGLYLLFVSLCAFALGGYIAGRMRSPLNIGSAEAEFRDGMHGLVTWGLAILMTAALALGAGAIASQAVAPSGGSTGAAQSVAGENIIASELDELFRAQRLPADLVYRRAEAARILLKASSHDGIPREDKTYLSAMVGSTTGIGPSEATARVDREIEASTRELRRARIASVLQAFFVGAALLVGAAVAWFTAEEGGRDREANRLFIWEGFPRTRARSQRT
ncbi:MAG: hypothetical protein H0U98_10350 [Alphaproteobacteria bacterium]|nr:hypothetical protein [Alphaproteobacteria bacterium]